MKYHCARAAQYVEDVLSGKQPVCKWVLAACDRQKRDLARQGEPDWPYRFNEAKANMVCHFVESLPHIKGKWGGRPIRLEPWQQFILSTVFGWVRKDSGLRRFRTSYIEVPRKNAKALALETPIPTPNGWLSMADLRVGDLVFDRQGKPCSVVATTGVMRMHACYRIRFSDGSDIVADAGHLWLTTKRRTAQNIKGVPKAQWVLTGTPTISTTEEIRQTVFADRSKNERNHKIAVHPGLQTDYRNYEIHPYVLGVWLGDGHSASARFVCSDEDHQIVEEVRRCDVSCKSGKHSKQGIGLYLLGSNGRGMQRATSMQAKLRALGLLNNKHIPRDYLRLTYELRLNLLQGLMDTDGSVSKKGQCVFSTCSEELRDGVFELLCSLGLKPTVQARIAICNGKKCGNVYKIQFYPHPGQDVFRLKRKRERQKTTNPQRSAFRQITAVERVPSVPVRCIQVDSLDGTYLAGRSMIITHNSTLSSGVGLYMLTADGEPGAEVYSAATTRDQAKIVFCDAQAMARREPELREEFGVAVGSHNIHVLGTSSKFEALSADAHSLDGLNVHCAIVDELHAHKTRAIWDVLETATGARAQSLIWSITTAGSNRSGICYEQRTYLTKLLDRVHDDETYFGVIYSIDDGDDWVAEESWRKANPNYGVSIYPDDLHRLASKAMQMPAAVNNFLTKRLCCWVSADSGLFDMLAWDRCADSQLQPEIFLA